MSVFLMVVGKRAQQGLEGGLKIMWDWLDHVPQG